MKAKRTGLVAIGVMSGLLIGFLATKGVQDAMSSSSQEQAAAVASKSLRANESRNSSTRSTNTLLTASQAERVARGRLDSMSAGELLFEELMEWLAKDPEAALEYNKAHVRPLERSLMFGKQLLMEWAKTDPDKAWEWGKENAPYELQDVLKVIAALEPEKGWKFAQDYVAENPEEVREFYNGALEGIAAAGKHQEAIEMLLEAEIKNNEFQVDQGSYSFVETIVEDWMRFRPEEGKEWLRTLLDAENGDKNLAFSAYTAILSEWVPDHYADALEFATSLPESEPRRALVTSALTYLVDSGNVTEAAEWLMENGGSPDLDWNLNEIASHHAVIHEDPENSLAWIESIHHDSIRDNAYEIFFYKWLVIDPPAAEAYLSENEGVLSEESMSIVRSKIDSLEEPPSFMSELVDIEPTNTTGDEG